MTAGLQCQQSRQLSQQAGKYDADVRRSRSYPGNVQSRVMSRHRYGSARVRPDARPPHCRRPRLSGSSAFRVGAVHGAGVGAAPRSEMMINVALLT
eukprot:scaffold3594_cov133-Isochrysis_galbana.AAC.1